MKKGRITTVVMALGGVLFVVGLIISLVGLLSGGVLRPEIWRANRDERESLVYEITGEIASLDVDVALADVRIISDAETPRVEVENYYKDALNITEKDGRLKVVDDSNRRYRHNIGILQEEDLPRVTIHLASGDLESLDIDGGVGILSAEGFNVGRFELSCGVGDIELEAFTIGEFRLQSGVGNASFERFEVSEMSIDMGVGNIEFSGDITKYCEVRGGVGNVSIRLSGPPERYAVSCEGGVGEITLDGRSYHGGLIDRNAHADGYVTIDIEGGVGSIEISTGG
jgi:hypothetical protein